MWRREICRGVLLVTIAPGAAFAGFLVPPADTDRVAAPPPRVRCAAPSALTLHRFEDRSAHLLCGRRVLVRITVPG